MQDPDLAEEDPPGDSDYDISWLNAMPNDFEFGVYFIYYQLYLLILEILILCSEINIFLIITISNCY